MNLCRICLSHDFRLYSVAKYGLDSQFQLLTGMAVSSVYAWVAGVPNGPPTRHSRTVDEDMRLPQWVCAECGLRLLSYNKLRQKSLRAHQILCDVLSRSHFINIEDLNWTSGHIETRLTQSEIIINQYDPNIKEDHGFLSYDEPIQSAEIKVEDLNIEDVVYLETKQTNEQTDNQNYLVLAHFNNQGDNTSNDEEVSLSTLSKPKIRTKRRKNSKDTDPTHKKRIKTSKQKYKAEKSSQKHEEKNTTDSETIDQKQNKESRKRINKKEYDQEKESNHRQTDSETINQKQNRESRKRINKKKDDLEILEKERERKQKDLETINHKQNYIESATQKRTAKKEVNQSTDKRKKQFPFETMFTVTNITTEELKAEVLKRKMSSNYINASFQCTDCFKGFCDEETYERHRLRHSQDWGSMICDICRNHYPCKRTLARHFTRMHSLRYRCRNCNFVASSRGSALRHGLKHMGKKYQCKQCLMEYVNYTTYLNHVRKSHTSEFVCELCGFSFVSALGVRHHKRIIHRLDQTNMVLEGPECTTCDIRFATEEAYAKHFKFSAKHVVKAYDVKQKRLNQGIKQPTFCEQCDLKLDSQSAYFAHFKSAHPGVKRTRVRYTYSFMCEQCGRIFKSNIALEEHKRIHRKEKPFICQQCGRAFTQKVALKMHAAIHDEHRTLYPCHLCEKRFTNRNNLKRHVFLHSGARPFECESCGKTFKTKSEKHTHYEYVHLKKPWPKRERHKRAILGI